ncbi:Uma2 family endonuclease [Hymenobacter defluvii]|uniref:Uma2 family endonuclease n=1 Tax=Hymenobacter defluvii TaxID=2054411 RepID=A0ABS3TD37_9BACT|nr:Uma2 family endonuclease [Hymenobacter defluvii]
MRSLFCALQYASHQSCLQRRRDRTARPLRCLRPFQAKRIRLRGYPNWIIEILSLGSMTHDSKTKFDLYEENEVEEYWMVDPGLKT